MGQPGAPGQFQRPNNLGIQVAQPKPGKRNPEGISVIYNPSSALRYARNLSGEPSQFSWDLSSTWQVDLFGHTADDASMAKDEQYDLTAVKSVTTKSCL